MGKKFKEMRSILKKVFYKKMKKLLAHLKKALPLLGFRRHSLTFN